MSIIIRQGEMLHKVFWADWIEALVTMTTYSSDKPIMGKTFKIFFSETMRPTAYLFGMKQCLVVPYIYPTNQVSWVQTGPFPFP